MSDIKRTFLTGLLVAGVLMLMPFYFNLIGYESSAPSDIENKPSEILDNLSSSEKVAGFSSEIDVYSSTIDTNPRKKTYNLGDVDIQEYHVSNNKFDAILTNLAGGSLVEYTLKKSLSQYRGGYNDSGEYNDSIPVSLILNKEKKCAPCVQLQASSGDIITMDFPFKLESSSVPMRSFNAQSKKIILDKEKNLVLIFKAVLSDKEIISALGSTLIFLSPASLHTITAEAPSVI